MDLKEKGIGRFCVKSKNCIKMEGFASDSGHPALPYSNPRSMLNRAGRDGEHFYISARDHAT